MTSKPYATRTQMLEFKLKNEVKDATDRMKEWENIHPYRVDL